MKMMNRLLFRTLSCRTSHIRNPLRPLQWMMLPAVGGAVLGTFLRIRLPSVCGSPLLTQGLSVCTDPRTLWDVFLTAGLPPLVMLLLLALCSTSAFGQAGAVLLLILRGCAAGSTMADCFFRFGTGNGFFAASVLVLPFSFVTILILADTALRAVRAANSTAGYLFRGITDPDIAAKQSQLYLRLLTFTLLTLTAAGVHTLLCWAMNAWLISAAT